MPPSSKSNRIYAAQKADEAAREIIGEVVNILGSHQMWGDGECYSAGIPVSAGRSMLDAQKFRLNWYLLRRRELGKISRLLTERNWFVEPVTKMRHSIISYGFRFDTKEAREWAQADKENPYDFQAVHDDLLHEYLVSTNVVAIWKKNPEPNTLPYVWVPDVEDLEYRCDCGESSLVVSLKSRKLDAATAALLGERMADCVKRGKNFLLTKNDLEWDFEVLKSGKRDSQFTAPSITGILDDIDFIEAVKVGDWNGAWARREMLRITKKGSSPSSGANAGRAVNNAKPKELQAILKAMKSIKGKQELVTNWDQESDWLVFPKDHFHKEIVENALSRLLMWGGYPAALLLRTEAQVAGVSPALLMRERANTDAFRLRFKTMLMRIFNAPSFKKNFPSAPRLEPEWSDKHLYSPKELQEFMEKASSGFMSVPTVRQKFLGVDDDEESEKVRESHDRRKDFSPPWETRQGLLPMLFPDEFVGKGNAAGGGPGGAEPGAPGRPSDNI